MEPYPILLAVVGLAVLAAAVLPRLIGRLPVSVPMVIVAVGMLLFALPFPIDGPQPGGSDDDAAERLTELVVIVSLMGAGLKLRRPPGLRTWAVTWRLLGITMPLTVITVAVLGAVFLGLPPAAAILLGAVLAPTDPVLASDVQLGGPGDDADDDAPGQVRFAVTSEAGLNDGLAFPITNLAIAIAGGGAWFVPWLLDDVIAKLAIGLAVGVLLGRVIGRAMFSTTSRFALARSGQGFVALGATLAVYGICELVHGYGFLAVFVAAVVIRRTELHHDYQQVLHDFAETLEQVASVLFLLLLGGAAVDGALEALTPTGVAVALAIVLVVRPLAGWIGLLGNPDDAPTKAAIAFFGIRGMGTIYYLAHAVNEELFPLARTVWAVAVATILASIVIHGMSASPALAWLERRRSRIPTGRRAVGATPAAGTAPS